MSSSIFGIIAITPGQYIKSLGVERITIQPLLLAFTIRNRINYVNILLEQKLQSFGLGKAAFWWHRGGLCSDD
jgi:hypothetical protein